ncbi:MAG: T9SS type A sorting domain-containing protein, partial [Saprospiraceae bacterium]|nr:T9SS type A sorting domain-containing protein [Saprospiraceae bacterium]
PCVEECLVDGGMVSGDNNATSFEFCVGDGEIDSINLSTTSADTLYQFVITDTTGLVLDLPSGSIVDFENTPAGTCYIYGLAYEGSLEIALGENINSDTLASDCAELSSNFITVERFDSGGPCQTVIGPPLSIVLNRVSDVSFIFDIKNIGVDTIDVSDYWICKTGNIYINIGNAITECGEFGNILAPGDIKGLNISLDNADGELAIYTSPTFDDPTAMIHYVEWGSSGHSRSDEAISAGLWSAGDFVPAIASGQSIYYSGGGYTSASWNEGFTNQCGSFVDQADIVFSRVGDSGQVIDLENISSDTIDVNDYLIKQEFNTYRVGDLVVECGNSSRILEPGDKVGLVVIPMSNVDGELALFTSGSNAAFNVVSDYVQWGSAGHQHENFAVSSGVWSANDFVPTFTSGQSIYYDGDGDASIDWAEGATNLCGTITKKRIDVAISPNPAVENIAIKIMDTEMPITQMSILNGDGKMMMNASMEMNTGDVYQMGLGSLSPGMYFLRMKSRNAVITERIMIIK